MRTRSDLLHIAPRGMTKRRQRDVTRLSGGESLESRLLMAYSVPDTHQLKTMLNVETRGPLTASTPNPRLSATVKVPADQTFHRVASETGLIDKYNCRMLDAEYARRPGSTWTYASSSGADDWGIRRIGAGVDWKANGFMEDHIYAPWPKGQLSW